MSRSLSLTTFLNSCIGSNNNNSSHLGNKNCIMAASGGRRVGGTEVVVYLLGAVLKAGMGGSEPLGPPLLRGAPVPLAAIGTRR